MKTTTVTGKGARALRIAGGAALVAALVAGCWNSGMRWEPEEAAPPVPACEEGETRCTPIAYERCEKTDVGVGWVILDECYSRGLVCVESLGRCAECQPKSTACKKNEVVACGDDGSVASILETCQTDIGFACRAGQCLDLCQAARSVKSNVGCEYWAVDLDNARISGTSNAAAQQFAVVVSNPQPDVPVEVRIFQDDGSPGDEPAPIEIANSIIAPLNLQVFKLGPREVDGSAEGTFNSGTHTALTRHAYKVTTNFPIIAYQFNPLENANVFSNDASLLKPREAYTYDDDLFQTTYVVAGWPQTIAITDDPNTNFNPSSPIALRAFLTIVGTREDTRVRVTTKTRVVPGGPVPATPALGQIEVQLGAFDVLNLESDDFNGDFTGSIIESDGPVAVFSGNEASDAPWFETLSERRCCADHLEDQLDPVRAAGKKFAVAHTPSRTTAVVNAGAYTAMVPEPDYVRFIAVTTAGATIKTSLPPPDDEIVLTYQGAYHEVTTYRDFVAESNEPITVSQVMASQEAAGIKRSLPGGDPSLVIVPPTEQHRPDYTFLTPDKYAFDFVSVVAPVDADVYLDGALLGPDRCTITPTDGLTEEERGSKTPPFLTYTCQLGFATIDPLKSAPDNLTPGAQNDGVHRLVCTAPASVIVTGFDSFVSYGYAAGTELKDIAVPE
jgi:hypothetical protein